MVVPCQGSRRRGETWSRTCLDCGEGWEVELQEEGEENRRAWIRGGVVSSFSIPYAVHLKILASTSAQGCWFPRTSTLKPIPKSGTHLSHLGRGTRKKGRGGVLLTRRRLCNNQRNKEGSATIVAVSSLSLSRILSQKFLPLLPLSKPRNPIPFPLLKCRSPFAGSLSADASCTKGQ